MAKVKTPIKLVTSPVGTLKYAHLVAPDMQENLQEHQRKDGGVYNTMIQFDTNDTAQADFVAQLTQVQEDNIAKVTAATPKAKQAGLNFRPIFSVVYDANDEDTGFVECKATLDAKVTPKNHEGWEQRVKLFDKDGNYFEGDNIGNGTKARVKLELRPYGKAGFTGGVSLRLHQLQIVELVLYTPDADSGGDTFSNGSEPKKDESNEDTFGNDTATSGRKGDF